MGFSTRATGALFGFGGLSFPSDLARQRTMALRGRSCAYLVPAGARAALSQWAVSSPGTAGFEQCDHVSGPLGGLDRFGERLVGGGQP
eukprot:scaffold137399_cov127-Phaeocystis_antarctica.AAC.1